jgi:hypothetical protein
LRVEGPTRRASIVCRELLPRLLSAWKGNSAKVVSAILNMQVHEGGDMRLSTGRMDRSQHYIL